MSARATVLNPVSGELTAARRGRGQAPYADLLKGIAPEWSGWAQRWREHCTLTPATRSSYYLSILMAGRWLARHHPDVTSPAHWTPEIAAAYVAAIDRMTVGDWASDRPALIPSRVGKPIRPRYKDKCLAGIRAFFRDCQEWGWMPRRLSPTRSLATPSSVRRAIGPDPRVVDDEIWAKLVWAGLHVETTDLPHGTKGDRYPLAMIRAIAAVWLFAGLRRNEISRLRLGCVRWQRHDVTIPETGDTLPREAICLLDVPVNKTNTAYTKPVHPLVGQRIREWEALRPRDLPPVLDPKTGEMVDYLFRSDSRRTLSLCYINNILIPLLCRKAGVPESDARGPITSHRARSTIASQLYNAKDSMTLFELQAWLGHSNLRSTQHYAQISPTKLAKAYIDADYFGRTVATVQVLIDQETIMSGGAAAGDTWKYYDLGHGYCTYSFYEQCAHRMACAKCPFYLPKASTRAHILEGKANLARLLEMIPLTEDERAAVEDGQEAFDTLLAKLTNVPTPTGLSPRELAHRGRPLPVLPAPRREVRGCGDAQF